MARPPPPVVSPEAQSPVATTIFLLASRRKHLEAVPYPNARLVVEVPLLKTKLVMVDEEVRNSVEETMPAIVKLPEEVILLAEEKNWISPVPVPPWSVRVFVPVALTCGFKPKSGTVELVI